MSQQRTDRRQRNAVMIVVGGVLALCLLTAVFAVLVSVRPEIGRASCRERV